MPTIYGNATDAGTYWDDRGYSVPESADADSIAAALLIASEWIDNVYGAMFPGQKTGGYPQERQWPRIGAYTNVVPIYTFTTDEIPKEVVNATYEAAYRQLVTPGSLQVDYTPGKYKRVSIDGAISVDYAQFSSSSEIQKTFPIIDQLLSILFYTGADGFYSGYSSALVR